MCGTASQAILPLRWDTTMVAILRLPVTAWDCPTTAAGEIDTERKKAKMWNNGQGNGNGQQPPQYAQPQGYGGQEDVYGRLNNTREVGGARFPFLEATGRYALVVLEEFLHSSDGPSARAIFEVIDCRGAHAVGSHVVKIWKLVKPPYKPGMTTGADEFADFCRKLKGAPAGYPIGNDIRTLMKERVNDQLARGTVIDAVAVPNKKGTWINVFWNAVQQTPQDIAAMRQRLEQKGIPQTGNTPQGGQFQGAPHPSQLPPQGYQGQTQQWPTPPQGPPPGYPQPPQYAQPQAPQGAPQGPGVPLGGFLANVPPQGSGGPQGGNGGSGTW